VVTRPRFSGGRLRGGPACGPADLTYASNWDGARILTSHTAGMVQYIVWFPDGSLPSRLVRAVVPLSYHQSLITSGNIVRFQYCQFAVASPRLLKLGYILLEWILRFHAWLSIDSGLAIQKESG
jgi:hypothetical protein